MTIYIVSLEKMTAVVYTGKNHHMSYRAAARRVADDALVIEWDGSYYMGRDVLEKASNGQYHLSTTHRELMQAAV